MASGEPPPRHHHVGDKTWVEEQRELALRNAAVQRAGKKQRETHERRLAAMRRAADAEIPDGRWR